jgi:hypothetical protein
MKKLSLKLEDLKVDSFTTVASEHARGTVGAHLLTAMCFTALCSADCSTETNYDQGCATTEFPSKGQNNCTTLIEE